MKKRLLKSYLKIFILLSIFIFSLFNFNTRGISQDKEIKLSQSNLNLDYSFNSSEYFNLNERIESDIINYTNVRFDDNNVYSQENYGYTNNFGNPFGLINETFGNVDTQIEFLDEVVDTPAPSVSTYCIIDNDYSGVNNELHIIDFATDTSLKPVHYFDDVDSLYIEFHFLYLYPSLYGGGFWFRIIDDGGNLIWLSFAPDNIDYWDGGAFQDLCDVNLSILCNLTLNFDCINDKVDIYVNEVNRTRLDFLNPFVDGIDKWNIQTYTVQRTYLVFTNIFYYGNVDYGYMIFEFDEINDPKKELWNLYSWILMNISSNLGLYADCGYYGNNTLFLNIGLWDLAGGHRNIFASFYLLWKTYSIPFYYDIFIFRISTNVITELKIFGYCFLENALYYGALAPAESSEINVVYGLNSSVNSIQFQSYEWSFNYFYINNTNNYLYFHVEFYNSNKNYISFFWKLFIRNSFHKRTFITFDSYREPEYMSIAYLTLSHWGTMGYYNQSLLLPDIVAGGRYQLASNNVTSDSFEMIYFNCSDIVDDLFTNYSINGYLSNFIVEYRIIIIHQTIALMLIITPLLMIVIPSLVMREVFKQLFIPMKYLMILILYLSGMCPLWVFFTLMLTLTMYVISEKEVIFDDGL